VSREVSALVREQVIEPLDRQGRIYRVLAVQALQGA
jgi:CRP/FNR family transcriptional regulator, anaerobic regulatory protein